MDILLVGTYTQHDAPAVLEKQELGEGIYLIPYNETLGGVTGDPLIIRMQNPSWVCLVKNRLFAVSESEAAAEIVEYEVRVQEERLTAEQKAGLQMPGNASCHIEKDEKGQRLFVSDYGSGDLKVIDISEAGSPKLLQEISFTGRGLDPERQEASHIHSCFLHEGDLYAADLGCDKIYSFGTDKGKLLQKETIEVRPGAGPRHMEILEKNGLEYDEKLIIRLKPAKRIYTIENGYNCTCELLKSGVDFSCIYAISDTLAVGACRAIIDSGKRVPEDYCVAGADGQDIAEYYHPSITTLKYPRVETAQQSVRTLFDLIDRKKVVKRQILGGTLIERESTRKL